MPNSGGQDDNTDAYIDLVAQAVIDKIEERGRVTHLVEMVAARVIEMQKQEAALQAKEAGEPTDSADDVSGGDGNSEPRAAKEDGSDDVGEAN